MPPVLAAEADRKIAEKRDELRAVAAGLAGQVHARGRARRSWPSANRSACSGPPKYRNIVPVTIEADATMSNYKTRVGQSFYFTVTGSATGGYVWGTDRYTDDSNVSMAAVHAGGCRRARPAS